ncbi:1-deoxy-D-xylulose-5-phosphate reductoisomerase [Thermanaerovibrio acidaminovorans]|uniref:1-deoxy-D-xylulose-5-phosphate reductoisomerase n=1 Tax=Thermanaerovibrio acidaminovorans TaxID=81462 RepID=UPI0003196E65|nr:1-deoxy-D-xylulose-5-phosphate reductoisomerase [Thermanaerovibrio acidaminovorans]
MSGPLRIGIVGATGSVGSSFVSVCSLFPDRFKVVAVASGSNWGKLSSLAAELGCSAACLVKGIGSGGAFQGRTYWGIGGLLDMIRNEEVDHWAFLASGTDCIPHFELAVRMGIPVSIANKESLVVAGPWILPLAKERDQIRPVDSEHSAIWQCLMGEACPERIVLTASGGPFRDMPVERLRHVTPAEALAHPVWSMGAKITVDSATMANKGIECIEAMRLFGLPMDRVDAVIHPTSQVHGMVLFPDGTWKMLVSQADMRLPAAMALSYPDRLPIAEEIPPLELGQLDLSFSPVDPQRFRAFYLAKEAGTKDGPYPALFVGADEVAVESFLLGRIPFNRIPDVIEEVMGSYRGSAPSSVGDSISLVQEAKEMASRACARLGGL